MDVQCYVPAWYKMRKASSTAAVDSTETLYFLQQQNTEYFFQKITGMELFN